MTSYRDGSVLSFTLARGTVELRYKSTGLLCDQVLLIGYGIYVAEPVLRRSPSRYGPSTSPTTATKGRSRESERLPMEARMNGYVDAWPTAWQRHRCDRSAGR